MAGPIRPVRLFRGDTWARVWRLKDAAGNAVDLTGATARLHARDTGGALVLEASTLDGRIVVDGPAGEIAMTIPFAATEALAPDAYKFDLEVTWTSGRRQTYESNTLNVREDMTRG